MKDKEIKEDKIFTDKIKLTKDLLASEGQLISTYNKIYQRIKIDEIRISDLYDDGDYFDVWRNLMELYDFLEFKYAPKLKGIKDGEEEFKKLNEIIKDYRVAPKAVSFEQLQFAYDKIRRIMQLSGFHDVSTRSGDDYGDFSEEED